MDILTLLTKHEGVRLTPYRDTVGKLTIGIGRNLDDVGISRAEADYLLANDVRTAQATLTTAFPWFVSLTPVRQDVLVNMCFNMGIGRLKGFKKMLVAMEQGDTLTACHEMLDSKWAHQVGQRANDLATLYQ
jgi:lysozyme